MLEPTSVDDTRPTHNHAPLIHSHAIQVSGVLRPYVTALVAAELRTVGPLPLAVAPHDSMMLTVQLGAAADCIEQKDVHGQNTTLTGIRRHTGEFVGAGDCVTLFALLTPLGAMQLLDSQPLAPVPRIRAPVADLLDRQLTRRLESDVAMAATLQDKLWVLAAWLESRASAQRRIARAGMRAGRAAMRLCAEPGVEIEVLADEQHVSRRQLERDFSHWIGTSPRHLSQVARVQAVSRRAGAGASLADAAVDAGFFDQAHMSRVVRRLTGLTPKQFASSQRSPMAPAFRRATHGATVYL
jgi:AraC-like DNA-binding protein